ncbi:MAG: CatA-like O-acetyltransferase, family 3 [Oscillospiraceae bacterium]
MNAQYKIIDMDSYYRKGVFKHFSEDCKCSVSMTSRVDVTELYSYSKQSGSKFYINVLYLISKVLNSRDDYRMTYFWQTNQLAVYDKINPIQYIFHEDTETCTPVYTEYFEDYKTFYDGCKNDIEKAKQTREYRLDTENHPNWFDASYISWLSYDSLNIELPDGYLHLPPIINWGRFREENGRLMMPISVRLNHAAADGYLVAKVFKLFESETEKFLAQRRSEINA